MRVFGAFLVLFSLAILTIGCGIWPIANDTHLALYRFIETSKLLVKQNRIASYLSDGARLIIPENSFSEMTEIHLERAIPEFKLRNMFSRDKSVRLISDIYFLKTGSLIDSGQRVHLDIPIQKANPVLLRVVAITVIDGEVHFSFPKLISKITSSSIRITGDLLFPSVSAVKQFESQFPPTLDNGLMTHDLSVGFGIIENIPSLGANSAYNVYSAQAVTEPTCGITLATVWCEGDHTSVASSALLGTGSEQIEYARNTSRYSDDIYESYLAEEFNLPDRINISITPLVSRGGIRPLGSVIWLAPDMATDTVLHHWVINHEMAHTMISRYDGRSLPHWWIESSADWLAFNFEPSDSRKGQFFSRFIKPSQLAVKSNLRFANWFVYGFPPDCNFASDPVCQRGVYDFSKLIEFSFERGYIPKSTVRSFINLVVDPTSNYSSVFDLKGSEFASYLIDIDTVPTMSGRKELDCSESGSLVEQSTTERSSMQRVVRYACAKYGEVKFSIAIANNDSKGGVAIGKCQLSNLAGNSSIYSCSTSIVSNNTQNIDIYVGAGEISEIVLLYYQEGNNRSSPQILLSWTPISVPPHGNQTPTANSQGISTTSNQPKVITLTGSDPDGDNLTFSIASSPNSGSLGAITQVSSTSVQVTYTPNPDYGGLDAFTFIVNDGTVDSAPATITVSVSPPVFSDPKILSYDLNNVNTARLGDTIAFRYGINNANSSNVDITLGAQISMDGTNWRDDYAHDVDVTLSAVTTSEQSRLFTIPNNIPTGGYDARWVIYEQGNPGNIYDTVTVANALTVQPATSPDTLPPATVTDFNATDGDNGRSSLTWTNPSDSDLAEVVVRRKEGANNYPTSHTDGTQVFIDSSAVPGASVPSLDSPLANGVIYSYAVFSRDSTGNWNDTVTPGQNADTGAPSGTSSGDPILDVSPPSLYFVGDEGSTLTPKSLAISNNGGGALNWSISSNRSWIQVSPTSGSGYREVTVSIDTVGLRDGNHSGELTITASGAQGSPAAIPISLRLNDPSIPNNPPRAVNASRLDNNVDFDGDGVHEMQFAGSAIDSDGYIALYRWTWTDGNGYHSIDTTDRFIYLTFTQGTNSLTLTVFDDDGASSSTSITVTVEPPPPPNYTLSAQLTPSSNGGGTFQFSPSGGGCGTNCTVHPEGTQVTITATPDFHSALDGWVSGCDFVDVDQCTVTVLGDTEVFASFTVVPESPPTFVASWTLSFHSPEHIAVDRFGDLYVVDPRNHRIQKFDNNGNFILEWGIGLGDEEGILVDPRGIAIDGAGEVYVVDSGRNRIQVFDSNGNFLRMWGHSVCQNSLAPGCQNPHIVGYQICTSGCKTGTRGRLEGQFDNAAAIAVDSGSVYVTEEGNHRIQKFRTSGMYLDTWGGPESGSGNLQFDAPQGVATSGSYVYVSDTRNNRIVKYTAFGAYVDSWDIGGQGHQIVIDGLGDLFVAVNLAHQIKKYTPTGALLTQWGTLGTGNGQFSYPIGVAIDSFGNVFVSDKSNNRIQKFAYSP